MNLIDEKLNVLEVKNSETAKNVSYVHDLKYYENICKLIDYKNIFESLRKDLMEIDNMKQMEFENNKDNYDHVKEIHQFYSDKNVR